MQGASRLEYTGAVSEQARDRAVLVALVVVSAAVLMPLRPYGLQRGNEGWLLHPVMRMLEGEVLYRDVLTYYAPLYYHLVALAFTLFGPSFLLSRTLSVIVLVATAALAYRVGRRWFPTWFAWCPPLVYVLAPGPWVKAPYGSAPCCSSLRAGARSNDPVCDATRGWGRCAASRW